MTVTVTYELGDNGMTATVNARNDGDEPAPWALGLHPWLANGKQAQLPPNAMPTPPPATCRLRPPVM